MYNRYIPQPDGSYRRMRHPEPQRSKPQPPPKQSPPVCEKQEVPPYTEQEPKKQPRLSKPSQKQQDPVSGFLQQLLPKDFDTGDLIVVLLLLLMAGDSEEGRSNALLTMALYFIM